MLRFDSLYDEATRLGVQWKSAAFLVVCADTTTTLVD